MKKLKIVLLFSIILFISYHINLSKIHVPNKNKLEGVIKELKMDEDKITFTINNTICNYYYKIRPNIKVGEYVTLKGEYVSINNNTNFNLFNYKNYLLGKKIYYKFNVKEFIVSNKTMSFLYKIKNAVINRINKSKNKVYLKLFILGDNELDQDINNSLKISGINHLFAISGMHITLFTSILLFLINLFTKNKYISFIVISILLLFYMFLTNFSPSVLRASLLFITLNIKKILHSKISNLYLIILLLLILLIYNPFYIYNIGFLYSFIISISLIYFSDKITGNYIVKIFKTSLIAFLVSMPLTINNNYFINLLTPFLNILYVPFVSLILFPLCLINFVIIPIDFILNFVIYIFETILFILKDINLILYFKKISFTIMIIYYLIIYFLIKKTTKLKIIIFILLILIHYNIRYLINEYNVTFIDVGQGDSTLIEYPSDSLNILIDTGGVVGFNNKKTYNLTSNTLVPYITSRGIKKIDYLILTHGDFDHLGEAINLVNNFKVEKVIFNCGKYNNLEKELIKVLDKKNIKYYSCIKKLNFNKNKLYFLQTKEYDNENDNSNVIYIELNGYKFMFMGDASITTVKEILDKYNLSDIDVLKVGHHGSKTSSSIEFINEINPKYSIISVGKNNRFGHPNKEVLETLKNSKIYRTDLDGSIKIKLNKNGYKIRICPP